MDPLSLALFPRALNILLGVVALGALISFFALPRTFFVSRRCASKYRRWLKDQGLQQISRDDRIFFRGPFFGEAGAGHVVFRAEFKDETGRILKAFLRCGDHGRGLLGRHDLDVRWGD